MSLYFRRQAEREILTAVINTAKKRGWKLKGVDLGDYELEPARTTEEALTHVFSVDDCYICFEGPAGVKAWVRAVLGNSGWDVVSDYTTNLDDVMIRIEALVSLWEERL